MRKVTEQTARAFLNREHKTVGNTTAFPDSLYLHGNLIAERVKDNVLVSFAGWHSVTTKERLNGLCELLNGTRPFHTVDFQLMMNGEPIDSCEWIEISA